MVAFYLAWFRMATQRVSLAFMKAEKPSPLTIAQAAVELGVSPHTVRAWIGRRRLGHLKLGRAVRVPHADVQRLIDQSYTPPLPERPPR
jgi:excisionase family DNA binding protein